MFELSGTVPKSGHIILALLARALGLLEPAQVSGARAV
jgi:hypothetical protein